MSELPSRAQVQSQVRAKFPGLPGDSVKWVSGVLSDFIEEDPESADSKFHEEMERALRSGEEHAIRVALAALAAV